MCLQKTRIGCHPKIYTQTTVCFQMKISDFEISITRNFFLCMREKLAKNKPYKVGNEVKVYNRFDNEMKNKVFPFEKVQRSNDIAIDCF